MSEERSIRERVMAAALREVFWIALLVFFFASFCVDRWTAHQVELAQIERGVCVEPK